MVQGNKMNSTRPRSDPFGTPSRGSKGFEERHSSIERPDSATRIRLGTVNRDGRDIEHLL